MEWKWICTFYHTFLKSRSFISKYHDLIYDLYEKSDWLTGLPIFRKIFSPMDSEEQALEEICSSNKMRENTVLMILRRWSIRFLFHRKLNKIICWWPNIATWKNGNSETNEKIRLIIQPNIFVWYSSLIPYHLFLFTFYQWKKRQFHPSFLRWHFASTHGTAIKIRLGTDTTSNLWIRVERGSTVQYCVCTTVLHAVHGKYQKQNVQCRLHAIHALSLQT